MAEDKPDFRGDGWYIQGDRVYRREGVGEYSNRSCTKQEVALLARVGELEFELGLEHASWEQVQAYIAELEQLVALGLQEEAERNALGEG